MYWYEDSSLLNQYFWCVYICRCMVHRYIYSVRVYYEDLMYDKIMKLLTLTLIFCPASNRAVNFTIKQWSIIYWRGQYWLMNIVLGELLRAGAQISLGQHPQYNLLQLFFENKDGVWLQRKQKLRVTITEIFVLAIALMLCWVSFLYVVYFTVCL